MIAVAPAQSGSAYGMAINQAKRDSEQNNAEQRRLQNEENGGASAQPATGSTPPTAIPLLAATLQYINNIQAALVSFIGSTGDLPDPVQRIGLLNDLSAAAQGSKASADSVQELAKDLFTALAGNKKLLAQKLPLARQVHAVFNSSHPNDPVAAADHLRQCPKSSGGCRGFAGRRRGCRHGLKSDCRRNEIASLARIS